MEKHFGEQFLNEEYSNLPGSKPVERAVQKNIRAGEKGPLTKEDRISAYLDRLEGLALDPEKNQPRKMLGAESRPRALMLLREMVMDKYVRQNKEKLAQGAARVEENAARQIGADIHYREQELEQRGQIAVTDLEKSLDNWITYLSDMNEPYPVWFRYYAFRNILNLGDYNKDKGEFTKRSAGSTRLFPDIERGALAYTEQMIEASKDTVMLDRLQKAQLSAAHGSVPENELITKQKANAFAKLSFAKQYAEGIRQTGEITPEMREETEGKWVKYQQGTDPTALWASLQNKGTAWCTKGFATAETQLQGGDFYVYYSFDRQGNPTIPRLAIRMEGHDKISNDVRGVADSQQNVEGNMAEILEEKLKDFGPEADRFKKKNSDMKHLTEIENKTKANQQLSPAEVKFLYEIDSKIEGFGYDKDPRIKELHDQRNSTEDMLTIFECTEEQIATRPQAITKNTKAYVGKLEPGIFELVQIYNIEHIYTSFPEGEIKRYQIEIGGKTEKQLEEELEKAGRQTTDYSKDIMRSKDFTTQEKKEKIDLIRLKVSDLGFKDGATTDEIYKKAEELGLELCPAEVGPQLGIQYTDQPLGDWFFIGMEQIVGRDGAPNVFGLGRHGDGLWLDDLWAYPGHRWNPDGEFVFRLSKSR